MNLKRHLKAIAILLLVLVLPQGCATTPQTSGEAALLCGAVGAAGGAAIGALVAGGNHALAGALIGAAIGGLTGAVTCFAIAEYKSQQTKGYQETQQAVQYRPDQGDVVQITNFALDPSAAAPGSKVAFNANYYVMNPKSEAEVGVTETRILKKFDPASNQYKEMGRPASTVTMKPGTRSADGKFDVRSGVEPGKYLLAFKVESGGKADEKEIPFVVTKDQALLSSAKSIQVTNDPQGAKPAPTAPPTATPKTQAGPMPGRSPQAPPAPATSAPAGMALATLGEPQQRPSQPTQAPQVATAPRNGNRYFVASKVARTGIVREGPGSQYRAVGEIAKNDRFPILESRIPTGAQTPWHRIQLDDGREGWVSFALGVEVAD